MNPFQIPQKKFKKGDEVRHLGTGETGTIGWVDRASNTVQLREWARNVEDAEGHVVNQRTRWEPMDYFELANPHPPEKKPGKSAA